MCKHDLSLDPYETAGIWEALFEDWKQNKVCDAALVGRKHANDFATESRVSERRSSVLEITRTPAQDPAMDERILRMLEHYKSEDLRSAAIGDADPCDASLPGLPLGTEMGFSDFYGL